MKRRGEGGERDAEVCGADRGGCVNADQLCVPRPQQTHTHTGLLEHCACNVKPMDFKETVSLQFRFSNTVQMQFNVI